MVRAGGLIVIESGAVADPDPLSVTLTVKFAVPALVGVPDITPPPRVRPAGSDPVATDQEYGGDPPDTVSACEYGTPTVPAGKGDALIVRAGGLIVIESGAVADPDLLSVAFTVKLAVPALPGVPEIVPLAERL